MYQERLKEIVDLSFKSLYEKINGGLIVVENEASLQLQISSILKTLGELFIYRREELFSKYRKYKSHIFILQAVKYHPIISHLS